MKYVKVIIRAILSVTQKSDGIRRLFSANKSNTIKSYADISVYIGIGFVLFFKIVYMFILFSGVLGLGDCIYFTYIGLSIEEALNVSILRRSWFRSLSCSISIFLFAKVNLFFIFLLVILTLYLVFKGLLSAYVFITGTDDVK